MNPRFYVALNFVLISIAQAAAVYPWKSPAFCTAITKIVTVLSADQKATGFCSSFLHIVPIISTSTVVVTPTPTLITSTTTTTTTTFSDTLVTETTTVTSTEFAETTITSTCTPVLESSRGIARRTYPATTKLTTTTKPISTYKSTTTAKPVTTTTTTTTNSNKSATTYKPVTTTTNKLATTNPAWPTPTVLIKSASYIISSACSCLSIPTTSTTLTTTSTRPQSTIVTTTTGVVTETVTRTSTTTVSDTTTTTIYTSTATAEAISTFNGQYTSPAGTVFNQYSNTDFAGGDLGYCKCHSTNQNCMFHLLGGPGDGLSLGRCNSFQTCQDACDTFNNIIGNICVAVSYSSNDLQICYLKYSWNGPDNTHPACGETYPDTVFDSAFRIN